MTDSNFTVNDCRRSPNAIRVFLGGSFDPVHIGHIAILYRVYNALRRDLDRIDSRRAPKLYASFLPTSRSPLKSHSTIAQHRQAMLAISCLNTPFDICDIEITRPAPTYTIDTLRLLRLRYPDDALIFVLGADSVVNLMAWREGLRLTDYSHLWVLPRGDSLASTTVATTNSSITRLHQPDLQTTLLATLPKSLQSKETRYRADLKNALCGRIYIDKTDITSLLHTKPLIYNAQNQSSTALLRNPANIIRPIPAVSSSEIRTSIASHNLDYAKQHLVPKVFDYIIEHALYTEPYL